MKAFPLRQYAGGSEHSAVFLTETAGDEHQKAAIKLIDADAEADETLQRWSEAAQLSHRHLLKVMATGRCEVGGTQTLYVVTEWAEEDLSQILPERALTEEETRGVLEPVLDALAYLHGKGLMHGSIKPGNIHAIGDTVKLSSDSIGRSGRARATLRPLSAHDAPEAEKSTAADAWSLGVTLAEMLTQKPPKVVPGSDGVVLQELPEPFGEIARNCLRRDPGKRWNVGQIAARLNPRAVIGAPTVPTPLPVTVVSISAVAPVSVPLSPVAPAPRAISRKPQKQPGSLLPAAAVIFAMILIFGAVSYFRSSDRKDKTVASLPEPVTAPSARTPAATPAGQKAAPKGEAAPLPATKKTEASPEDTVQPAAVKEKVASEKVASPAPPVTAMAAREGSAKANGRAAKGDVLEQVLPEISQRARDTIHGTVRVNVVVRVEPSGAVSGAELDSPVGSQYFGAASLQAARKWSFQPPELDGKSVASEWRLRFEFTSSTSRVVPVQVSP